LHQVADYWEQVIIMNDHQRRFSTVLSNTLQYGVRQKTFFLGWAFKKDTNTRESAAIYIADDLVNEHANCVYDPKVSLKDTG
jgi:UDPglucose 6-dehydrogenase